MVFLQELLLQDLQSFQGARHGGVRSSFYGAGEEQVQNAEEVKADEILQQKIFQKIEGATQSMKDYAQPVIDE